MSRGWKWGLFVVGTLLVFGLIGLVWPLEFIFYMLFGWILYLRRVLPQAEYDWATIAMAFAALALFGVGLHGFLKWFVVSLEGRAVESAEDLDPGGVAERPHWKASWTASLVTIVMLLFMAGVSGVGIVHQVAWWAMWPGPTFDGGLEAGRRNHSLSQLKQMGMAAQAFSDQHGALTPGATADEQGRLLQGWQAHLLPFLEHGELAASIDFGQPWDDPANAKASQTHVELYSNPQFVRDGHPQSDAKGYALSDYASNERVIGGTRRMRIDEISDGTSRTIMAGEVIENRKPWAYPANWRDPAIGINRSPQGFGANWRTGGAQFVFGDGHASMINEDIDPEVLGALSTPAGGEVLPGR